MTSGPWANQPSAPRVMELSLQRRRPGDAIKASPATAAERMAARTEERDIARFLSFVDGEVPTKQRNPRPPAVSTVTMRPGRVKRRRPLSTARLGSNLHAISEGTRRRPQRAFSSECAARVDHDSVTSDPGRGSPPAPGPSRRRSGARRPRTPGRRRR